MRVSPSRWDRGRLPQPREQVFAVRSCQDLVERVALPRAGDPGGAREEVEVVVAQHGHEAAVLLHGPAQDLEGVRAAVDEVAHQPEAVLAEDRRRCGAAGVSGS